MSALPLPARPFSQPWADAFCDAINASVAYRESARGWTWPLALVLERAPEYGYAEDTAVVLDLDRGECRSARVLPAAHADAPFAVRGPYDAWKAVARGALDPVAGIMLRRLTLVGPLATLLAHVQSARELVSCAARVETDFPDEKS